MNTVIQRDVGSSISQKKLFRKNRLQAHCWWIFLMRRSQTIKKDRSLWTLSTKSEKRDGPHNKAAREQDYNTRGLMDGCTRERPRDG